MNSKKKTTATKEAAKPALVPKLRFLEFRGTEGWERGPLKESLSCISNGLALEQGNGTSGYRVTRIETISAGTIDLAKIGLIQTSEDISAYKLRVGDILLSNINSVAHIGKSVFVDRDYDLYHGMNLLRLEVNRNQHDPKFIFYAINTDWIRASLRERANKAVNQASINQTELGKTEVSLPLRPEQQKIAECLSSVDELMAAQARKVDALKTHKKGLMQQLFPREGETQPRLRFPEFQNAGEWQVKRLSSEAQLISGMHLSPDQYSTTGEVPYFTGPSDFTNDIESVTKWTKRSANMAAPDDTLITVKGSGVGEVWYSTLAVTLGRQLMAIRVKQGSSQFVFQFLLTKKTRFEDLGSGNLIPGLSRTDILDMEAHFPLPAEQHRIATCLSNLDALITAETQKLETLKTHKKGLMQQLFPSVGGVAGEA